jgi:hypothetical protein
MIGLAVLAGAALYFWVWSVVVRSLKHAGTRTAAIAIAVAIPLWDLPIGYYNFVSHCRSYGGVQQIERIAPQKTLLFSSITGYRPDYLFGRGLDSIEYRGTAGTTFVRFTKTLTGRIEKIQTESAESSIRLVTRPNTELPWNLYRTEVSLETSAGKIIARAVHFSWVGGWIQRQTAPMLATSLKCHSSSADRILDIAIEGSG